MMLPQLPAAVRIFVCTKPTSMHKSFDGLVGMVREFLAQDPLSGHLFLFFNRRRDRAKILLWDRDGLVIWYKRLEAGTFQHLDSAVHAAHSSGSAGLELLVTDLALLLGGIDLATARRRKRYSRTGSTSNQKMRGSIE
jgi:transposase